MKTPDPVRPAALCDGAGNLSSHAHRGAVALRWRSQRGVVDVLTTEARFSAPVIEGSGRIGTQQRYAAWGFRGSLKVYLTSGMRERFAVWG